MEYSLADIKSVVDGEGKSDTMGGNGFLWVILIFLFFLGFSGSSGLFGGNSSNAMSQVERDVLTSSCATQKEILESRFATQIGFQTAQAQLSSCCCDLKTAIHSEGEETRALITQNTIQELRDQLQSAQLSLQNVAQTQNLVNQLRPFPQPAYITCSPYTTGNNNCGIGNI